MHCKRIASSQQTLNLIFFKKEFQGYNCIRQPSEGRLVYYSKMERKHKWCVFVSPATAENDMEYRLGENSEHDGCSQKGTQMCFRHSDSR